MVKKINIKIKTRIEKFLTKILEKRCGNTAVGLDIGKHSIKLVQLKREGAEAVLNKIDSAEIAPASGNSAEDNRAVKKLIAGLFARNDIRSRKIILGINGQSAFIKFLEILPVKAENLEKTLKYEAQQQIPFSLEEVEWDSHLFGPLEEGRTSAYRVLLVAVKKDRLAAKEDLLEGLKRRPSVLDVSNLSVYNCIRFNRNCGENETGPGAPGPGKLRAVLDIGAQSADLLILKGGDLWMRSIAIGGDNITAALARKLNISFSEAQELKQKSSGDSSDIKEAVTPVLEDLQGEISRSIEFYYFQQKPGRAGETAGPVRNEISNRAGPIRNEILEEILLGGGGSLTPGLDKFLAEKFSCRVRCLEPFKMLRLTEEIKNKLNSQNKALFSQAVGLALRGLSKTCININLLKGQIKAGRLQYQKLMYGVGSVILSLVILFGASSFMRRDYREKSSRLKNLKSLAATFAAYQPEIKELQSKAKLLSGRIDILRPVAVNRALWLEVLRELQKLLPDDLWITEFAGTIALDVSLDEHLQSRIDLKGRAVSYGDVNNFVAGLKSSPLFTEVKPLSSAYIEDDAKDSEKAELVKFSISMKVLPVIASPEGAPVPSALIHEVN